MQNAVELVTPLTLEECRRLLRCQLDRPFPFSRGKRCFKCLDFRETVEPKPKKRRSQKEDRVIGHCQSNFLGRLWLW